MQNGLRIAAVAAFAWSAVVYFSGGLDARIGGVALRSRDPFRALVVGSALLIAYAAFFRAAFARDSEQVVTAVRRWAVGGALGAAVLLAATGIRLGTFSAGSADSFGYVSQAYGWASGELPRASALPLSLSWPSTDLVQTPLGYRRGPEPHTMVPTYAPGLPLMMAVAVRIAGACGPYLVVPLFAALLVWFTFVWGRRAAGPVAGLIASVILLTSPVVLFQTLWPMSDIPAAALWTGAAVAALTASRGGALGAGLLTAAGLLVRPNLPIVAIVPVAQVVLGGSGRERWIRLALAAAPVAVAAAVIALLNATWYGAPLNSGYGGLQEIYSFDNVWPNVTRYSAWLWQSQSGWVLTAVIPLSLRSTRSSAPIRLAYLLTAATAISYLAYAAFDVWWYLRFMLPAAGAVAVLMATGIVTVARRLPPLWGRTAAFFVVLIVVIHTTKFSTRGGLFIIQANERRYVDVGAYVARSLPENAVVFTMQHSGSIRFYGRRMSLRYDFIDRDWIPKALSELEGLGYHPFLVIDDWETPEVRKAFQLPPGSALPWRLMARHERPVGVSVFDMSSSAPPAAPVSIGVSTQPWCLAPQPMVLRRR